MQQIFGDAHYIERLEPDVLSATLHSLMSFHPSGFLLLACDEENTDLSAYNTMLRSLDIPVFGGIFPSIIRNKQTIESGILVIPVFAPLEVQVFEGVSKCHEQAFNISFAMQDFSSTLMLIDGLTRGIGNAMNQVFQEYGQSKVVFGGGAGSLSFQQKPCLFTPNGIVQDAMILVAIKQDFELAIGHGWEVLDGPFLANQVDDNQILQLNFEPAVDVYREVIKRFDGRDIDSDNFFEIATNYPFGLERLDEKLLVRDPITLNDKALVCVGRVPESTMLYILKGDPNNLISAAAKAIEDKLQNQAASSALLFDCISRKLFLEDEFAQELQGINNSLGENTSLFGALVLGEIASNKAGGIDLHNKTAVTAIVVQHD
ncbi:FIST signal transduction protein [Agaribacter flavus]|uniref:FIST signal transduction protein n=1 Tax=Agaribacter flavus TaxID=1902781 RepID=A0ABV7FSB1_9ALTE